MPGNDRLIVLVSDGAHLAAKDDAPVTLPVVGESAAGQTKLYAMSSGTAVKIMTGAPVPSLPEGALPHEAFHGTAAEQYFVPSGGENPTGGAEFLRIMLSKEQAEKFAERDAGIAAQRTEAYQQQVAPPPPAAPPPAAAPTTVKPTSWRRNSRRGAGGWRTDTVCFRKRHCV